MKIKAIMVDLDGTLSSCEWRRHWVTPEFPSRTKHWVEFFDGINADAPVPVVMAIMNFARDNGFKIILTTARPSDRKYQTEWWLTEHNIEYDYMFMRKAGDSRHDHVVKREIFLQQIRPYFDIEFVVDDRESVCDLWRELGLNVIQVMDPGIPPIMETEI